MDFQPPKVVLRYPVLVRVHVHHLIEQFYPNVYVLSFNEINNNIQIQAVGTLPSMVIGEK